MPCEITMASIFSFKHVYRKPDKNMNMNMNMNILTRMVPFIQSFIHSSVITVARKYDNSWLDLTRAPSWRRNFRRTSAFSSSRAPQAGLIGWTSSRRRRPRRASRATRSSATRAVVMTLPQSASSPPPQSRCSTPTKAGFDSSTGLAFRACF